MFVSCLGRALMSVGVLVVLLGATPPGPSVTIGDDALTPPVVAGPAGGSVLWTNRGTRQHEIVAIGGAFPSFSLAPEGTRSVPFMQPGRYPYLLDGAVKGTVLVVASGGGGAEGTGGGGQSPASRKDCVTIYRYDVRVAVHRERMPADPTDSTQVVGTVSDWKASWVAPLYVDRCTGMPLQITARSAEMSGNRGSPIYLRDGQFDRTFDWNDTTGIGPVPPCHFTYASHLPAQMYVTAQFGFSSAEEIIFNFFAGQDVPESAASKADRERALDAERAACDPKRLGISFYYTYIPKNGIPGIIGDNIGIIGDAALSLNFTMPPNSPVEASILDSLVAGKGFNYDTGMQLVQGGDFQSNSGRSPSRVRATVSFSRLEN
jgi:hypothetical protein